MKKQSGRESRYVLDSSAFIAFFDNEDGAEIVEGLLSKALEKEVAIFCSFASYMELFYITYQKFGKDNAGDLIERMNRFYVERVESSNELSLIAGELKALYKVSFADAWIAATAMMLDAVLVHKDPEFDVLDNNIKMLKLPYKRAKENDNG